MQIVIDVPDGAYKTLLEEQRIPTGLDLEYLVMHGTPLPKGHGRMIDGDAIYKEVASWGMNDYEPSDFLDEIDRTPTIIEKEGRNDSQ